MHQSPECVADLVRNLRYLDPESLVLVYNGSNDQRRDLDDAAERAGAVIHPHPAPIQWGRMHPFGLRCMAYLAREVDVDAMTVVDSDQLMLRPGYVEFLQARVEWSGLGMLSNSPGWKPRTFDNRTVRSAWDDVLRFRPWLAQFPESSDKWPHYTFWPGTVVARAGMHAILRRFGRDPVLTRLASETTMQVTEEILFPTLTALLGLRVDANPCRQDWVKFRPSFGPSDVERALAEPEAFFMHAVPRVFDDPVRERIRDVHAGYASGAAGRPLWHPKFDRRRS